MSGIHSPALKSPRTHPRNQNSPRDAISNTLNPGSSTFSSFSPLPFPLIASCGELFPLLLLVPSLFGNGSFKGGSLIGGLPLRLGGMLELALVHPLPPQLPLPLALVLVLVDVLVLADPDPGCGNEGQLVVRGYCPCACVACGLG